MKPILDPIRRAAGSASFGLGGVPESFSKAFQCDSLEIRGERVSRAITWNFASVAVTRAAAVLLMTVIGATLSAEVITDAPASRSDSGPTRWLEQRWSLAEGLPQSSVLDLAEARGGHLWVATFGGLVRFNGSEFRLFDTSNTVGLSSNQVTAVELDPDGDLWVATAGAGVLRFSDGRVAATLPPARAESEIVALAIDRSRAAWIRETNGALRRWHGDHWIEVLAPGTAASRRSLVTDDQGAIWASDGLRLSRFDERGGLTGVWMAGSRILSIGAGPTSEQAILLGLENGVAEWTGSGIRPLSSWPVGEGGAVEVQANADDSILAASASGLLRSLRRSADGDWRLEAPLADFGEAGSILTLAPDGVGGVWVGTERRGLVRLRPARVRLQALQGRRVPVTAIIPDSADGVWGAFGCAGLGWARDDGGDFVELELPEPGPGGGCIHALHLDDQSRLWIGRGHEVLRLDDSGGSIGFRANLGGEVTALFDWNGRIGVARHDGRLARLAASGDFEEERSADPRLSSIRTGPDGALWIGSNGALERRSEGETRRWGRTEGMRSGLVRDLHFRDEDSVWIASYGAGLGLLRGGRVRWITREEGLPDQQVTRVIEDDGGRFWLLTNRGIVVLAVEEVEAVLEGRRSRVDAALYGAESGMSEGNFGQPAGFRDRSGRIWFNTIEGVASIDPDGFPFGRRPPSTVVDWVEASGRRLSWTPGREVVLPPGSGALRILFSVGDLDSPTGARAVYRLTGRDSTWSEATANRFAEYLRISPGRYSFELTARSSEGLWADEIVRLRLRVEPEWWQTALAKTSFVIVALCALLGAHFALSLAARSRVEASLRESELRLAVEARVARARSEVAHLQRVSTAGQLSAAIAHDLKQPLAAIVANAAAAERILRSGAPGGQEMGAILGDIVSLGRRGSQIVDGIRRLMRKDEPTHSVIPVDEVVSEALLLMRGELERKSIEVSLVVERGPRAVLADRTQLLQVVVNLLTNAVEAVATRVRPRRVSIASSSDEESVRIEVRDNGPGVAPDVVGRLFEPLVTSKSDGMGMGLAICREIVETSGGRIEYERPECGGAVFRVRLPLAPGQDGSSAFGHPAG